VTTANLDSVQTSSSANWQGPLKTWRFSVNPNSYLGVSSDGKRAYVGTADCELIIIDVDHLKVIDRLKDVGYPRGVVSMAEGDVLLTFGSRRDKLVSMAESKIIAYRIPDFSRIKEVFGYVEDFEFPFSNRPMFSTPNGDAIVMASRLWEISVNPLKGDKGLTVFPRPVDANSITMAIAHRWIDSGKKLLLVDSNGMVRQYLTADGVQDSPAIALGNKSKLSFAEISQDGSLIVYCEGIASAAVPARLVLWDVKSQKQIRTLELGPINATQVAFLDGSSLAIGKENGEILIWNSSSKEAPRSIQAHNSVVKSLRALSPSRIISTDGRGFVMVLDTANKSTISKNNAELPSPMAEVAVPSAVSSDRGVEAVLTDRSVLLRSVATGKQIHELPYSRLEGVQPYSVSITSLDEPVLLAGATQLCRWIPKSDQVEIVNLDISEWQDKAKKVPSKRIAVPVFSADRKLAVTWNQGSVGVFEAATGKLKSTIATEARELRWQSGVFSKDRIAIECQNLDSKGPRMEGVRLFDLEKGTELARMDQGAIQSGIAFCPERSLIISSAVLRHGDKAYVLVVRNIDTDEVTHVPLNDTLSEVAGITSDGRRLITVRSFPGTIYIWDFDKLTVLQRFDLMANLGTSTFDGLTLRFAKSRPDVKEHVFRYLRDPGPKYAERNENASR
jgi:WD40 repeat protein